MQRIAVLRPGALGDTILTLPALAALRAAFPRAHLTFVGHAPVLPLLADGLYADAVLSADDSVLAPLFAPLDCASPLLQSYFGSADLAVLWLHDHAVVAQNLRSLGVAAVVAAPSRPPLESPEHVADYLLDTIAPFVRDAKPPPLSRSPRVLLTERRRSVASAFWQRHSLTGRRVIAIHPGSGGRWKCWPAERFAALADLLARRGLAVLLVAGPADEAVVATFTAALHVARPVLASGLAVPDLAAVLAPCAAFIGNDSGISHLAAATGVPTTAIYGPTDPRVWGVRGERVALVYGESLHLVTVAQVLQAVDRLL